MVDGLFDILRHATAFSLRPPPDLVRHWQLGRSEGSPVLVVEAEAHLALVEVHVVECSVLFDVHSGRKIDATAGRVGVFHSLFVVIGHAILSFEILSAHGKST